MMDTIAMIESPIVWGIIAVVILLFGGSKIPEIAKGLGQGMRELKKGMKEDDDDELRKDRERKERIEAEVRTRVEEEDRQKRESRDRVEQELRR